METESVRRLSRLLPGVYLAIAFGFGWVASNLSKYGAADGATPLAIPAPASTGDGAWVHQSQRLIDEGRYAEAIAICERGLNAMPDDRSLRNNLAVAKLLHGEVREAEVLLTALVGDAPDFVLAGNNLEWAQSVRKEAETSIVRTRKNLAATSDPRARASMLWTLGVAYAKLGDHEAALEAYGNVLKLDPRSASAANNAGVALMSLARYADALKRFEEASRLEPDERLYANNVRWARDQLAATER